MATNPRHKRIKENAVGVGQSFFKKIQLSSDIPTPKLRDNTTAVQDRTTVSREAVGQESHDYSGTTESAVNKQGTSGVVETPIHTRVFSGGSGVSKRLIHKQTIPGSSRAGHSPVGKQKRGSSARRSRKIIPSSNSYPGTLKSEGKNQISQGNAGKPSLIEPLKKMRNYESTYYRRLWKNKHNYFVQRPMLSDSHLMENVATPVSRIV